MRGSNMAEMSGSAHVSHYLSAAAGEYVSTVQGEMIKTVIVRACSGCPTSLSSHLLTTAYPSYLSFSHLFLSFLTLFL